MFRWKTTVAMIVTALAVSFGADQASAWHHFGYHHFRHVYGYYSPVVVAPAYSYSYYRPVVASYPSYYSSVGVGCGYYTPAYRRCCSYYTPAYRRCGSYYTPAYRRCCGTYGVGLSYGTSYYGASPGCCGSSVTPSYYTSPSKVTSPAPAEPQPAPAEVTPGPAPAPAETQPNSVLRTPTPPAPTDVPPSLPPVPDAAPPTPPVPAGEPTPALPLLPDGSTNTNQSADSTILTVHVPEDARVYVNGMLTKTPGTTRQYLSRGLVPGHQYTYEVRAEVTRNGRKYSNARTVQVRAGEMNQVAFQIDPRHMPATIASTKTDTSLTLNVPTTAKVSLEGRETDAAGAVRTFTTRELSKDQRWQNYNVVVEFEQNGRLERREKTIDLIGGQTHELTFDFQPPQVALR